MTPSPSTDHWTVETPRPSDRGLVARLLEDVVALDPEVAPPVAARSVRPAQWLQQPRPAWTGVVVVPGVEPRTVVGYAAVVDDPEGGRRLSTLLVAPALAGRGVDVALTDAASVALGLEPDAPVDATDDEGLVIGAVTYPDPRVERPRRRAAVLGAGAIALAGTLGVLAVQVGSGPLGGVLPFLAPDPVRPAAGDGALDPTSAPSGPPLVVASPVPGATIAPDPAATGAPQDPVPGGGPSGSPTSPPTPPPSPSPPPGSSPGPVSSLLDPVVTAVVSTVDGLTGGALSPVTGTLEDTTDTGTDVADTVVETVLGLLPTTGR